MSVAIGMPHPLAPSPEALKARKIAAGTSIPPSAAIAGNATAAAIAKLPDDELALDLHPDDEEEQRHQQVVHDVGEVLFEPVRADVDADRRSTRTTRSCPATASSPRRGRRPWQRRGGCRQRPRCAGTAPAVARRERARRSLCRNDGVALRMGGDGTVLLGGSTMRRRPGFPAHHSHDRHPNGRLLRHHRTDDAAPSAGSVTEPSSPPSVVPLARAGPVRDGASATRFDRHDEGETARTQADAGLGGSRDRPGRRR